MENRILDSVSQVFWGTDIEAQKHIMDKLDSYDMTSFIPDPNVTETESISIKAEQRTKELEKTVFDPVKYTERVDLSDYIRNYEATDEEAILHASQVGNEEHLTGGYGHYYDHSSRSKKAFRKALPDKDYNMYATGKLALKLKEAEALFQVDLDRKIGEARRITNQLQYEEPPALFTFDDLSFPLRKNIIAATFRGSWGYSKKARRLVREGRFSEGSTEFLDSQEYRDAQGGILPGLVPRMDAVSKALADEARTDDAEYSVELTVDTKESRVGPPRSREQRRTDFASQQSIPPTLEEMVERDLIPPWVVDVQDWFLTKTYGKKRADEIKEMKGFYRDFPEEIPKDAMTNPLLDQISDTLWNTDIEEQQQMINDLEQLPARPREYAGYVGGLLPYEEIRKRVNAKGKIFVPADPDDYNQVAKENATEPWQRRDVLEQIIRMQPKIKVGALWTMIDESPLIPIRKEVGTAIWAEQSAKTRLDEFTKILVAQPYFRLGRHSSGRVSEQQLQQGEMWLDGYDIANPRFLEQFMQWQDKVAQKIKEIDAMNYSNDDNNNGYPDAYEYLKKRMPDLPDRVLQEFKEHREAVERTTKTYKESVVQLRVLTKSLLQDQFPARNIPQGVKIGDLPSITVYDWNRSNLGVSKSVYNAGLNLYQNKLNQLTPEERKLWERKYGTIETLNNLISIGVIPQEELMGLFTGGSYRHIQGGQFIPDLQGKEYHMDIETLDASEGDYFNAMTRDHYLWMKDLAAMTGATVGSSDASGYSTYTERPLGDNSLDKEWARTAVNLFSEEPSPSPFAPTASYTPRSPQFAGEIENLPPEEQMMYLVRTDPDVDPRTGRPLTRTLAEYPLRHYEKWADNRQAVRTQLSPVGSPNPVFMFHGEENVTLPIAGHEIVGHGSQMLGSNARVGGLRPRPDGSLVEEWAHRIHEIAAETKNQIGMFRVWRGGDTMDPLDIPAFIQYIQNRIDSQTRIDEGRWQPEGFLIAPPTDDDKATTGIPILREIIDTIENYSDAEKEALRYMVDSTNETNQVTTMRA